MVIPPDDGHRYARNMYILAKYTKNKLCIKFDFLYTSTVLDRLCGLVVRVSGYRYRGPGFDSRRYQIF